MLFIKMFISREINNLQIEGQGVKVEGVKASKYVSKQASKSVSEWVSERASK